MIAAVVAGLAVSVALGQTPLTREQVNRRLQQADQLERQAKLPDALRAYEQSIGGAKVLPPEQEAAARLKAARLRAKVHPEDIDGAVADLKRAAEVGTPALQRSALNDLGVLLLQAQKPKEALQALEELELRAQAAPELGPQERAVYAFNLGRALLADGQAQAAFRRHEAAVRALPTFSRALEGALDALVAQKPAPLPEAQALLASLVASNPRAARTGARRLLVAWREDASAASLLPVLARALAEQGVTAETFAAEDWPELSPLDVEAVPFRRKLVELRQALAGDLDFRQLSEAASAFRAWARQGEEGAAFRELLFHAARTAEAAGRERSALMLYAAAWARDGQDLEAAARLAEVLQAHPQEADRYAAWLAHVVEQLFDMKGQAYMEGDRAAALRLHLVLGSIFARSPGSHPRTSPRSAIFQFERALAVEQQLHAQDPQRPPAPGVHAHLAEAYAREELAGEAWPQFMTAAEQFLSAGNSLEASRVLERCRSLPAPTRPEIQGRMDTVEQRLSALPGPEKACQGKMVDVRSDAMNCGNCGVRCEDGATCRNGGCTP